MAWYSKVSLIVKVVSLEHSPSFHEPNMAVMPSWAPLFAAFLIVLLRRNLNDLSVFFRGINGFRLKLSCMRNQPFSRNVTYDTLIQVDERSSSSILRE